MSKGKLIFRVHALHPRLAELWFIRCQTSLNSLISGANFGNYVRVTDSYRACHRFLSPIFNHKITQTLSGYYFSELMGELTPFSS